MPGSDSRSAAASPPDGGRAHGGLSALLEELAGAPERDVREAWERGLRPGAVVGRFELVRELGRGGFGVVFEARDRALPRSVAFKALRAGPTESDPARRGLLRREADAIATLQHPNIVTLFDFGSCESGPYLVLELLRGEPLSRAIERAPLPPREAVRVASAIARALVHAHGQGVLHRDLKPANVFLCRDGEVKVLDFGLAHVFGAGGPAGSGTPGYMAPEQLRGEPEDARTDVFSVGVLLREMLAGARLGEDGSSPAPAAARGPPALEALVVRCLEADPARRPRDARELRDALAAVEREWAERELLALRRRRRRVVAAAAVTAALALGAWAGARLLGPDRAVVVVADVANDTRDPSLDPLSGMLLTSLEQSRRLAVLPRARLVDLAGEDGPDPRVDEAAAREVARRIGADVLVAASVRPDAGGYAVEVRTVDPDDGTTLRSLAERAPDKAGVIAALDRLSDRTRRALRESERDRAERVAIGEALTESHEAYLHYFLGLQCAHRPLFGQDCTGEFRKAVALDPGFAAAHYELAVLLRYYGGSLAAQRAATERALAHSERAPEKERLLIRAWAAHLDGKDAEALALYRRVTEAFPQDPRAFYEMGDILRHRDEYAAAVPWFEEAARLDPGAPWALGHLVETLGATGATDALRERALAWEAAPSPVTLHALSLARGWLGDVPGALEAAQRGLALGGGLMAQEDLLAAAVFAGHYEACEAGARAVTARGSEVRRVGYYALAALHAYQGRRRQGAAALDALRRDLPEVESDALYLSVRADYLLGDGDPAPVLEAVRALRAVDPRAAAEHAPALAWLGARAEAASLARDLSPGSVLARTHAAVERWHAGERDGALRALADVSAEAPLSVWRLAPLWIHADLAARTGRDAEAAQALERLQRLYIPRMMWRSWAFPRSLLLLARSRERLGDTPAARDAVERLLAAYRAAEPDDPLLAEARALRARLGLAR